MPVQLQPFTLGSVVAIVVLIIAIIMGVIGMLPPVEAAMFGALAVARLV